MRLFGKDTSNEAGRSTLLSMALKILQGPGVSLFVIEAAALLVAAEARFQIWIVQSDKTSLSDDTRQLVSLFDQADAITSAVQPAWARFLARDVTGDIERHAARPRDERSSPEVRHALDQRILHANDALAAELHALRVRLEQLMA